MTKTQKIVWMSVGTWVALVPALLLAFSFGPDARYTGAPGDDKLGCATGGCHTNTRDGGPVNPAGGSVVATFSGGTTYTPGVDQTITVTINDPSNRTYGFQMSARLGTTDADLRSKQAGKFINGTGTLVICDVSSSPRTGASCPAATPVEFIEHSSSSRTSTFTFKWTPPPAGSGPVTFYVAGNAANGNGGSDGGDRIYLASYVLNPAATCTTAKPAIAAIVQASAFGQAKTFAAGSWLEIYGTNLTSSSREWGGADFSGSNAPTKLDDVSVSINGKPAAVRFISSGQVNVNAPGDAAVGPVNITLTNCNATSDPFQITKDTVVPGILGITINGKQYMGSFTLAGALTGNPNAPAKPGDIIVAYGIGFGDTSPLVTPGTIAAGLTSLANFKAFFGTAEDTKPVYAGLGPGFVGLYQFDLTVPKLADGDYQMNFQIGSVKVPQTLLFTVKN